MSENTIKGTTKQVVGATKEATGKLIGDKALEAEGAIEKAQGTAQKAVGELQDKLGDAIKE